MLSMPSKMKYKPKHVRFDIVGVKLCKSCTNDVKYHSNVYFFKALSSNTSCMAQNILFYKI